MTVAMGYDENRDNSSWRAFLYKHKNTKLLRQSNSKAAADNKKDVVKDRICVKDDTENIETKGETAGHQQFLLLPQCFPKPLLKRCQIQAMLYDEKGGRLDSIHIKAQDIVLGEQLESDRYYILVETEKESTKGNGEPQPSTNRIIPAEKPLSQNQVLSQARCAGLKRKKTGFMPPRIVKQPRHGEQECEDRSPLTLKNRIYPSQNDEQQYLLKISNKESFRGHGVNSQENEICRDNRFTRRNVLNLYSNDRFTGKSQDSLSPVSNNSPEIERSPVHSPAISLSPWSVYGANTKPNQSPIIDSQSPKLDNQSPRADSQSTKFNFQSPKYNRQSPKLDNPFLAKSYVNNSPQLDREINGTPVNPFERKEQFRRSNDHITMNIVNEDIAVVKDQTNVNDVNKCTEGQSSHTSKGMQRIMDLLKKNKQKKECINTETGCDNKDIISTDMKDVRSGINVCDNRSKHDLSGLHMRANNEPDSNIEDSHNIESLSQELNPSLNFEDICDKSTKCLQRPVSQTDSQKSPENIGSQGFQTSNIPSFQSMSSVLPKENCNIKHENEIMASIEPCKETNVGCDKIMEVQKVEEVSEINNRQNVNSEANENDEDSEGWFGLTFSPLSHASISDSEQEGDNTAGTSSLNNNVMIDNQIESQPTLLDNDEENCNIDGKHKGNIDEKYQEQKGGDNGMVGLLSPSESNTEENKFVSNTENSSEIQSSVNDEINEAKVEKSKQCLNHEEKHTAGMAEIPENVVMNEINSNEVDKDKFDPCKIDIEKTNDMDKQVNDKDILDTIHMDEQDTLLSKGEAHGNDISEVVTSKADFKDIDHHADKNNDEEHIEQSNSSKYFSTQSQDTMEFSCDTLCDDSPNIVSPLPKQGNIAQEKKQVVSKQENYPLLMTTKQDFNESNLKSQEETTNRKSHEEHQIVSKQDNKFMTKMQGFNESNLKYDSYGGFPDNEYQDNRLNRLQEKGCNFTNNEYDSQPESRFSDTQSPSQNIIFTQPGTVNDTESGYRMTGVKYGTAYRQRMGPKLSPIIIDRILAPGCKMAPKLSPINNDGIFSPGSSHGSVAYSDEIGVNIASRVNKTSEDCVVPSYSSENEDELYSQLYNEPRLMYPNIGDRKHDRDHDRDTHPPDHTDSRPHYLSSLQRYRSEVAGQNYNKNSGADYHKQQQQYETHAVTGHLNYNDNGGMDYHKQQHHETQGFQPHKVIDQYVMQEDDLFKSNPRIDTNISRFESNSVKMKDYANRTNMLTCQSSEIRSASSYDSNIDCLVSEDSSQQEESQVTTAAEINNTCNGAELGSRSKWDQYVPEQNEDEIDLTKFKRKEPVNRDFSVVESAIKILPKLDHLQRLEQYGTNSSPQVVRDELMVKEKTVLSSNETTSFAGVENNQVIPNNKMSSKSFPSLNEKDKVVIDILESASSIDSQEFLCAVEDMEKSVLESRNDNVTTTNLPIGSEESTVFDVDSKPEHSEDIVENSKDTHCDISQGNNKFDVRGNMELDTSDVVGLPNTDNITDNPIRENDSSFHTESKTMPVFSPENRKPSSDDSFNLSLSFEDQPSLGQSDKPSQPVPSLRGGWKPPVKKSCNDNGPNTEICDKKSHRFLRILQKSTKSPDIERNTSDTECNISESVVDIHDRIHNENKDISQTSGIIHGHSTTNNEFHANKSVPPKRTFQSNFRSPLVSSPVAVETNNQGLSQTKETIHRHTTANDDKIHAMKRPPSNNSLRSNFRSPLVSSPVAVDTNNPAIKGHPTKSSRFRPPCMMNTKSPGIIMEPLNRQMNSPTSCRSSQHPGQKVSCTELCFPGRDMVEFTQTITRQVVIPECFSSVHHYKQILSAAVIENLNTILFDLSKRYHGALSRIDTSAYEKSAHRSSASSVSVQCKCGSAAKLLSVRKEGPNKGRQFYGCGKNTQQRCKFFQWAEGKVSNFNSGSGSQRKISDGNSLGLYMKDQHVHFYPECQLVRKSKEDIMQYFKKPKWARGKHEEDTVQKKQLFLKLPRKGHSSLYAKDDIWIVSKDLQFQPSKTFVARSTFYGPLASNEVEIDPLYGYSPSNWSGEVFCHGILAGNASSELSCLENIKEHLNAQSPPVLPHLLNRKRENKIDSNASGFNAPRLVSSSPLAGCELVKKEVMDEIVRGYIDEYGLNIDQTEALRRVSHMFCQEKSETVDNVFLLHGVFGAGKSFLLSVMVLFLVEIFKMISAPSMPGSNSVTWKLLISSTTNVAVDRILQGVLNLGFEDFVRVGSVKKIAKPILPFSIHASGTDNQELKDLQEMLRSTDLTPSEKSHVRQSIEKHRQGENKKKLGAVRVVGVTCASCSVPSLSNMQFPAVFLDECSQMTEPSSLLPIARFGCQKLLLVGDPKQLDPTIEGAKAAHDKGLDQTMFDRMIKMGSIPTILRTQYRCHPWISAISNQLFYGDILFNGVTETDRQPLLDVLPTICFYDVDRGQECCERGGSFYNEQEAQFVVFMLQALTSAGIDASSIGVITLYKSQMSRIVDLIATSGDDPRLKGVQVSTVDAFQGGERDVIILSCVRTQACGFIDNDKRTNVALTRAKHHLLIVGNYRNLSGNFVWGKVLQHCKGHKDGLQPADEAKEQLELYLQNLESQSLSLVDESESNVTTKDKTSQQSNKGSKSARPKKRKRKVTSPGSKEISQKSYSQDSKDGEIAQKNASQNSSPGSKRTCGKGLSQTSNRREISMSQKNVSQASSTGFSLDSKDSQGLSGKNMDAQCQNFQNSEDGELEKQTDAGSPETKDSQISSRISRQKFLDRLRSDWSEEETAGDSDEDLPSFQL